MTKISQYSVDNNIRGNDKWIGSDSQNYLMTKNFTPNNLADYFNGNNVIDIGTSIRYTYQTLDPGELREQGTISFETEIGPQVNFSDITTFLLAKNTLKGNNVTDYLDFLVDSKVLLSKSSNINVFGYYKITSIEPWIPNTNFFVVEVEFLEGNGFIYEDLDYLISLVDKVQETPPTVWGTITGDILDQTDLINYIDSQTPTLQTVTNIGNSTTNDIELLGYASTLFDNGSRLIKGTTDSGLGGNKGISLRCSVDYELKWEAGRLYIMEQDGFTIRESKYNFTNTPDVSDDNTKGYVVGSRWILDNGDTYVCTDDTTGAAVWEFQIVDNQNLEQVLIVGNESTTQDAIFRLDADKYLKIDRANQQIEFWDLAISTDLPRGFFNKSQLAFNSNDDTQTISVALGGFQLADATDDIQFTQTGITFNGVFYPYPTGATSQIATLLDIPSLTGYATELWVGNNFYPLTSNPAGYLTSSTGVTGSGTLNYLPKFASSNSLGNSIIYDDGTNIGIGTITPSTKLTVEFSDTSASPKGGLFKNTNSLGRSSVFTYNNIDEGGVFGTYGDSFPDVNYRNNFVVGATKKLIFLSDGNISNGGSSSIDFIAGGYGNTATLRLTNGLLNIPQVPITGATTDKILVRDISGNVKQIDYPTVSGTIPHTTAAGTDTYTATVTGVTSYADGDAYLVRFTNGNTTSCTLNINTLGAIPLYRNNDGALIGGDIWAGAEMLCVYNSGLNIFQCIGTSPNSLYSYVTNADSVTLTKGMPVYAFGGTGDRMTVKRANNTTDATSAQTVGLVLSTSIAANQKGIIIIQGLLDGLSILPTSTFADGDPVYLGATAGTITNVKPYAPNHLVYLGVVTTANNGSAGRMYVRVQNGYELDELHNVQAQSPSLKDTLWYDNTVSPAQWKTASISTILGYTPQEQLNGTGFVKISGTTISYDNSTYYLASNPSGFTSNLGTVTSVAALTLGTSGTDLSSSVANGTTTPVITLNVPTASATNRGVLSSTDWSTFNNKQADLWTFQRSQGVYLFEDFIGNNESTWSNGVFIGGISGAGASTTTSTSFPNRTNQQGVLVLSTGTTSTGRADIRCGGSNAGNIFLGIGAISLEFYVNIETLSTASERYFNTIGLVNNSNFSNQQIIGFVYDEGGSIGAAGGSANWKCITQTSNVTTTTTNSGVTVTASAWVKLRIEINASASSIGFYINDSLVATHTTNIPATSTPLNVRDVILKTVGTTSRNSYCDYVAFRQIFTSAR